MPPTPKGLRPARPNTRAKPGCLTPNLRSGAACSLRCACLAEKARLTYQDTTKYVRGQRHKMASVRARFKVPCACLFSQGAHVLRSVPQGRSRRLTSRRASARAPRCLGPEWATFATGSCPAWSSTLARIAANHAPSFNPDELRADHPPVARSRGPGLGFFLLFDFQRSPLRRSQIAESTPGVCIAARPFASWPLRLPVVPTPWFYTTPPAFSSSILSALLQRLTTLGFTIVSRRLYDVDRLSPPPTANPCDSRGAFLPFEAFPPPMAVAPGVGTRRVATALLRTCAGRIAPPARPSPRSAAAALDPTPLPGRDHRSAALKPALPLVPKDSRERAWTAHAFQEFTSRLTASPFSSRGKLPSHRSREPRGLTPSSGPLCDRRFQRIVPGAPMGLSRTSKNGLFRPDLSEIGRAHV